MTTMKKLFGLDGVSWALPLVCGIICLVAIGCGDTNVFEGMADENSKEARTEEALMAMDDGNYDKAISILSSLVNSHPNDDTLMQYLSSAYAGSAGLDTLDMLKVIGVLDDADDSGSIDMIGLVLGDSNGVLTSEEVNDKLDQITTAIDIMNGIGTLNDDQEIQLGVLSVTHLSLTLASIIIEDQGEDEITLTEEGINALYEGTPADFSDVDSQTLALDDIDQDLANITTAIDEIEALTDEDNDLAQDFEDFTEAINPGGGPISQGDLENYIDNL